MPKKAAKRLPSSVSKRWKARAAAHKAEEDAWELVELRKKEAKKQQQAKTNGDVQATSERGGGHSTGAAHTERSSPSGTNECAERCTE